MTETTNQTTMDSWDDTPLYDPRATWPEGKSSHPLRIAEVSTKYTDPKDGAATGWEIKKVKLEVANGELAGKPLFMDFLVTPSKDKDGTIMAKSAKIEKYQADINEDTGTNFTFEEAEAKAVAGVVGFAKGERQRWLRLLNAAGFIREQDVRAGDKNQRRIDNGVMGVVKMRTNSEGQHEIIGDDGNSTGTVFTDDMLVSRLVMGETAPEEYQTVNKETGEVETRMGRKVNKVWDVDPAEVGDLAESTPF